MNSFLKYCANVFIFLTHLPSIIPLRDAFYLSVRNCLSVIWMHSLAQKHSYMHISVHKRDSGLAKVNVISAKLHSSLRCWTLIMRSFCFKYIRHASATYSWFDLKCFCWGGLHIGERFWKFYPITQHFFLYTFDKIAGIGNDSVLLLLVSYLKKKTKICLLK